MKISIKKFTEHALQIDGFDCEHFIFDEVNHLRGWIDFNHVGCFPIYLGDNEWYSYEDEEDSWGEYEMQFNYRSDGKFDFCCLGDVDDYSSFYIYNPVELKQFIAFVNNIPQSSALNVPIRLKEFKLTDVVKKIYITVKDNNGEVKLCDIDIIKQNLTQNEYSSLMSCLFADNWDFLVDVGNWSSFCEDKNLPLSEYYGVIALLYFNRTVSVTNPYIDFGKPHLAFEILPEFSSQYFFDLMYYSKDGVNLMKSLYEALVGNKSLKTISITAPKDLRSQILYSSSFRLEYHAYLRALNDPSNLRVEEMIDLKSTCINRRENFQEYVLNKKNIDFLNSIKNPLPFILDKTFRSYERAATDFDRQTYSGRLFNYVLRSIVLYPLQELVYLKHHESNSEIDKILTELKSGRPISDGIWLTWFNEIARIAGQNDAIKLSYFDKLLIAFQKLYNDIQKSIPKRNDWAHYREHSTVYQKHIDLLLPVLLSSIRDALKNIDFIYVEKQEYKSENDLCITAKRLMGYEIDIETKEFSTKLPGHFFISKKLYAYRKGSGYTVPLEPFLDIKFENVETMTMGIFDNIVNGQFKYEY